MTFRAAVESSGDPPPVIGMPSIRAFMKAQGRVPTRKRLARFLGRSPLTAESRPWFWAALGEFEVCSGLARLDDRHRVLHSVQASLDGLPVDHVVIGPAGVFAVLSVYAGGQEAVVSSLGMSIAGHSRPELRRAQHAVGAVERCLSEAEGGDVRVTGVLAVIEAEGFSTREHPRDIAVIDAAELTRWLCRQPATLAEERVSALGSAAALPATWAGVPGSDCVTSEQAESFDRVREEVFAARLARQLWILAVSVVVVGSGVGVALSMVAQRM